MSRSSELKGIISDIDGVPGGALPPLLALVREDSQINFVTRNIPWTFGRRRFCPGHFFCHINTDI